MATQPTKIKIDLAAAAAAFMASSALLWIYSRETATT